MPTSLANVRSFLFDLDGTLYVGDRLLDGSLELLSRIWASGRSVAYVTNNSSRGTDDCRAKAERLGIGVPEGLLITSSGATADYLKRVRGMSRIYALGTPSFERELQQAELILDYHSVQAVVLGLDLNLTYEKVSRACHLIRNGAEFISTHPDLNCPMPDGPIPDCGALSAVITAATGVEPIVIGKPNAAMLQTALHRLDATPESTCIVGDRLYTDMEMGFRGGLQTVLVLSGEGTPALVRDYHRTPDWVVPSVRDLIPLIG